MREGDSKGDVSEFIAGNARVAVVASNKLSDLLVKIGSSKRERDLNVFFPKPPPKSTAESELKSKLGNMRGRVQAKSYSSIA